VTQRRPVAAGFPSDEESIALRREGAEREAAQVARESSADPFYGVYTVASTQWKAPYRVELRSLTDPLNSCSCQDYQMNRLGTCKHIERVLQFVAQRRKRAFAAAAAGNPDYEIFFDARVYPPRVRLLTPGRRNPRIEAAVGGLFGASGIALGDPIDAWAAAQHAVAELPAAEANQVRLSGHAPLWIDKLAVKRELALLQASYDRDAAAGKRSDNPVNLPLFPYQKVGMRHLAFKGRALLADEMGLGKTVQAIAAAELLRGLGKLRRVLVVAPASLKAEWEEQIHHFTGIQGHLVFGSRAQRLRSYSEEHAYTLTNYEQVRGDVDAINRLMAPDLVILDEAQRIKNWPTKTAKTLKRLRSPFAFVLTGTPLENRIEELYSLAEFVDPHLFGSLFRFQRDFMQMDVDKNVTPINLDQLHRRIGTIMLRRRKADVEDSLPPRADKNFFVALTDEQRARYADYEYQAAQIIATMKRQKVTKALHERLQMLLACMRMVCDTPYILDENCRDCPKLEELENILDEALAEPDVKIIVFSEWVRMLDLVKELLEAKGIGYAEHTGRVPQAKRREQLHRFKRDPACRIFLASEAGGTGLNLQVASIVINLDLPWNPAKLEQRIARAWRKHQTRPVRVMNIIAEGTIESGMLGKLAYKTALSDSVLDGAAFTEAPHTESGRSAFAERVGALLGTPLAAEETTPSPPPANLCTEICARHPDQILGIEELPTRQAALVVARPGANRDRLNEDARQASGGRPVEVIDHAMYQQLQRMAELGLITLSSELTTSFAADGYAALAAPRQAAPSKLHREAARARWRAAGKEYKAAQTLAQLDLAQQAKPHIATALAAGLEALRVLHCGAAAAGDGPPAALALGAHAALAEQLQGWMQPAAGDGEGDDDFVQAGMVLAGEVETALTTPERR